MTKKRIGKIIGYLSTLAIFIIGMAPATFSVPMTLRPWIFLGSIVWVVTFSSGVFSS